MPNGGTICCHDCTYNLGLYNSKIYDKCDIFGIDTNPSLICRSFRLPKQSHTQAREKWPILDTLAPGMIYKHEDVPNDSRPNLKELFKVEFVQINEFSGSNFEIDESFRLKSLYDFIYNNGYIKFDFNALGKAKKFKRLKIDDSIADKAAACMVGIGIGDAMGRAVESKTPGTYWIEKYMKWYGWTDGPIGTITDDTQLSMWLAESLIENNGLNPDSIAKRFTSEHIRGLGMALDEFVKNSLQHKLNWYDAATDSAGNGVAMRSAPIGLYYHNSYDNLKLASGIQAVITHNDPMAVASGIIVAFAISKLLRMKPEDLSTQRQKIDFCIEVADSIEGIEVWKEYRARNDNQKTNLHNRLKNDIPYYLEKDFAPKRVSELFLTGAYVLETLPYALYCFLYSPDNFTDTLLNAVNYSYDSDTIASIACSMSGALNGMNAIDNYYIDNLEFKDRLMNLGKLLVSK